jgi:putative NADPH-quinone reductase
VRDLYALYPDYLIDIAVEQAALKAAKLVVWQQPIRWYSMPPLLKLWLDDVLTFGWAYGPDGNALRGKDLWLVASTGGPEDSYRPDSYNRYFFDAFLPPYEQTAALCGMRFLPPLVLHGAHKASEAELAAHAEDVRAAARRLSRLAGDRSRRGLRRVRGAAERAADRSRHGSRLMEHSAWLTGSLIYLAAAVIAVPLARFLKLGSIIGYLGAGILIGPWGLKLVTRPEDMLQFAEFGVVLMLFLGRPRARAAAALVAAQAHLRLGQRPAVRLGPAARARRARLRHRLAPRRRRRARPGDVVDGDRPRRPRRAQRDGDDVGRGDPQRCAAPGHRRDPDPRARAVPRRRRR